MNKNDIKLEEPIHKWFDKDKWEYGFNPEFLPINYGKEFNVWWDEKKFVYNYASSEALIRNCPNDFDMWWNPSTMPYGKSLFLLIEFCSKDFHKWWIPSYILMRIGINLEGSIKTINRMGQLLNIYCQNQYIEWVKTRPLEEQLSLLNILKG